MLLVPLLFAGAASGQSTPAQPQQASQAPAPAANQLAQKPGAQLITLDQAIQMALAHNHNLLAARTTIQQSEAEEITANLRPDPVLLGDAQFLPIFQPNQFSSDYLDNMAQFDVGVSYLFERGKKRQHRLQAAKDVTAVTRSQVADNERRLTFNVAAEFINVELAESTLELAQQDLKSFQNTVDISQARYNAGDISEDDLLKIKLQLLQFQTDVSQAQLARVQGLSDLRQLLGYESVPRGLRRGRIVRLPADERQRSKTCRPKRCRTARTCGPRSKESPRRTASTNCRRRSASATSPGRSTTRTSATSTTFRSSGRFSCRFSIATRAKSRAPDSPSLRRRSRKIHANGQVLTDVRDAYENLRTTTRSSGSTARDISTRRSSPATSASTPTSAARPACSIFWTRNAVTGPRNSPTGRRWPPICWRWSSFAKRWEPGACHEILTNHRSRRLDAERVALACAAALLAGCHSGQTCAGDMTSFSAQGLAVGNAAALHHSAGPDVPRAGGHRAADALDAHSAAHRRGGLQRFQDHAGDHPGGRSGHPHPGRAGPARERASPCSKSAARITRSCSTPT